ncbi:hypothetical protein WS64_24975 [Burkholderia anthina]|uniref:Uncharacterized protein n=1 Tax=Burkholderia anthina TaxID=179879 RepID=A0AAW3PRZ7_9BURK|nr:hypothetical protein WS64_24975 [Burkholderia anthina]
MVTVPARLPDLDSEIANGHEPTVAPMALKELAPNLPIGIVINGVAALHVGTRGGTTTGDAN